MATRPRPLGRITERAAVIARLPDPVHVTASGVDRFLLRSDWTRSTRATYHQAIRAWCRWLITTGRRSDDPTILAPPPKVPRGRPRPLAAAWLAPPRPAELDAQAHEPAQQGRTAAVLRPDISGPTPPAAASSAPWTRRDDGWSP